MQHHIPHMQRFIRFRLLTKSTCVTVYYNINLKLPFQDSKIALKWACKINVPSKASGDLLLQEPGSRHGKRQFNYFQAMGNWSSANASLPFLLIFLLSGAPSSPSLPHLSFCLQQNHQIGHGIRRPEETVTGHGEKWQQWKVVPWASLVLSPVSLSVTSLAAWR